MSARFGERRAQVIERVNLAGKWMEFWWQDAPPKEDNSWHDCSQQYKFWNAYEKLYGEDDCEYLNIGLRGVIVEWEYDGNWEISRILGRSPEPIQEKSDDEL